MPTVKAQKTVADAVAKYKEKTAGAGEDWKNGVLNPSKLFTTAGIAAKGRWASKLQAAIANDSFAKGLGKVDLSTFDATVNALGGGVYTQGVAAKLPKAERAFGTVIPAIQGVAAQVRQLPAATDADRDNRALAQIRGARQLKGITKK